MDFSKFLFENYLKNEKTKKKSKKHQIDQEMDDKVDEKSTIFNKVDGFSLTNILRNLLLRIKSNILSKEKLISVSSL